jgi:hypothetical protein
MLSVKSDEKGSVGGKRLVERFLCVRRALYSEIGRGSLEDEMVRREGTQ